MRINSCCNTYAREGAPNPTPPQLGAPAERPQTRAYAPTQRAAPDTEADQPSPNAGMPYGTGAPQGTPDTGDANGNRKPTFNATQPSQPQEPVPLTRPGGSIDDANGNHVRDRWDEGGTHVRDAWNDRIGTRAHETWDADGTHVREAWSEQTGQHVRDTWSADGAHVRDAWDEQGNHLQEEWTPQGQYLRNAWDETTVRVQEMRRVKGGVEADPATNPRGPGRSEPASPGDASAQPGPNAGDAGTRGARPTAGAQDQRPVGDGRYGHGASGPTRRGHGAGPSGRGYGGRGGGGGSGGGGAGRGVGGSGGGSGNAAAPRINGGRGASQFSQAAMNRLKSAPQNLQHILDVALDRLNKYGANDPELQQWFGKNANVDEIRQTLTRMRETLASGDYTFSLDPAQDNWEMAHVFPTDGSHTIHVRPHMLDPVFGQNTPEVTIAHELSHFNDIGGTRDLKYGDWNASTLARTNSARAMQNAENYGMFIRQVAQLA
jgi:hypothetical protein